jgi:Ca2+-dependent lipid-binding protein
MFYIPFKHRMGNEKYRTKIIPKSTSPKWLEQFDFHLYDDQPSLLEVTAWDHDIKAKDEIIGRCTIALADLEREMTHTIRRNFEEGSGNMTMLVTISGTTNVETISDLASYQENEAVVKQQSRNYVRNNQISILSSS